MQLVDYHTHPYAHGGNRVKPAHNLEILADFAREARKRGVVQLGFSDHDRFLDVFNWDNLTSFKEESSLSIRLGLEVNYKPELELEIKQTLSQLPLDYVIGSVHCIDDWEVDHPRNQEKYLELDVEDIYRDYFSRVESSVRSGLFDIVGHLDLIKIFNYYPSRIDVLEIIEPVLKTIREQDMVMEINTNGLNKPVQEIYPSPRVLERAYELGIPLTLGSDAHVPERTGEKLEEVLRMIKEIGYTKITGFRERERELLEI